MRTTTLDAFILRLRPLGESDRIVTLFSRERGKSSAVAKGARKPASKFGARLDFFARSRVTVHAGRSLDVITGTDLVDSAWERLVEPDAFALASYAAEIVDGLCEPDLPVPEAFALLEELQAALGALPRSGATIPAAAMRVALDLRLLAALGFAPELDACARCGTELGRRPFANGRAMLSPEAGGLVCRSCLDEGASGAGDVRRDLDVVRISAGEFASMRDAREMPLVDALELHDRARVARVTQAFVQHQLGRAARTLRAAGETVRAATRARRTAGSA